MEWKKCINGGIGEATKKLCASIYKSRVDSSRVSGYYVYAYKVVDGLKKRNKRRVLKTNRYQLV